MSLIKRSTCIVLCLLFAMVMFPINANAVKIDGKIETAEWKGATQTTVFPANSNTNCDIDFAFMRLLVDKTNSVVFLAFQVTQKTKILLDPPNTLLGIKLTIKPGTTITCRNTGDDMFDHTSYSVNKHIVVGGNRGENNNDFVMEIRIGYLHGVPENPLAELQLIDSYGKYSNSYKFPVVVPTTAATTNPATTKPTTTKPTTTKATTTKPTTTKRGTKRPHTTQPPTANPGTITPGAEVPTAQPGKNISVPTAGNRYSQTDKAANFENMLGEEVIADETAGAQGSTDKSYDKAEDTSENEVLAVFDLDEIDDTVKTGSTLTRRQIAAILAAAILVLLAVYILFLASKRKTQAEPETQSTVQKADEKEPDDDF